MIQKRCLYPPGENMTSFYYLVKNVSPERRIRQKLSKREEEKLQNSLVTFICTLCPGTVYQNTVAKSGVM